MTGIRVHELVKCPICGKNIQSPTYPDTYTMRTTGDQLCIGGLPAAWIMILPRPKKGPAPLQSV